MLLYDLGMIYLKLGNEEKAAEHLRNAVESKQAFREKEEAQRALSRLERG